MNLGIHDEIHFSNSKYNTKPLLEVRVRMKFSSIVIIETVQTVEMDQRSKFA